MPFVCALSGTTPEQPVVSPVSWDVFERCLIEQYIEQHGTDPVNGLPLTKEQLIVKPSTRAPGPEAPRTEMKDAAPTADAAAVSDKQDLSAVLQSGTLPHTEDVSSDCLRIGGRKGEQCPADIVLTISRGESLTMDNTGIGKEADTLKGDLEGVRGVGLSSMELVEDTGIVTETERSVKTPECEGGYVTDNKKSPSSSQETSSSESSPNKDGTNTEDVCTLSEAGSERSVTTAECESGYGTDGKKSPSSSQDISSSENSPDKDKAKIQVVCQPSEVGTDAETCSMQESVMPAVDPVPIRKLYSVEGFTVPRQTIADLANHLEAGGAKGIRVVSEENRSVAWLRDLHEKLLKNEKTLSETPLYESCSDSGSLHSHLDGAEEYNGVLSESEMEEQSSDRVIAGRMLVRRTKDGDHVVLVGAVTMIADPLSCPFASLGQCQQDFCAPKCNTLKAHLESEHHLRNVKINLVCPYSEEINAAKQCREIVYDPQNKLMMNHIRKAHPDERDEAVLTLCFGSRQPSNYTSPKNGLYRTRLPRWVLERQGDLPSQEIPEMLVIPTLIKDEKLLYVCNQGCADAVIETHAGPLRHLRERHSIDACQTELYCACPAAAQGCPVTILVGYSRLLLTHVQAAHAELLGMSIQYSENALRKRKEMETVIESEAKRLRESWAKKPGVNADFDEMNTLMGCRIACPVEGCCFSEYVARHVMWHIGAVHRDVWNVE